MYSGNQRGDLPKGDPNQLSILLVDDHDAVRRGLSRYLQFHDFVVTEAANGEEAIAELKSGGPFSFLLTDLRLPDLEGSEVARAARGLSPDTWIALITGWDVEPDEPFLEYFDAVLQKPIDAESLVRRLRELNGRRSDRGIPVGL